MNRFYTLFFSLLGALLLSSTCKDVPKEKPPIDTNTYEILPFDVAIYQILKNDGSGVKTSQADIDAILTQANVPFNNAGIKLQSAENIEILSDLFYEFNIDFQHSFGETHTTPNKLNIILAKSVYTTIEVSKGEYQKVEFCGVSNYPWQSGYWVIMDHECFVNTTSFIHEIGHYFGLLHTHYPENGYESVARVNCTTTGDKLCDTPADYGITENEVDNRCKYIGTRLDKDGDEFKPLVNNFMSYGRVDCRDSFTKEQNAVMNKWANERAKIVN